MTMTTKKLLIVGAFTVGVIGIGYLLYITFFRATPTPTTSPDLPIETPSGTLPDGSPAGDRPIPDSTDDPDDTGSLPDASPVAAGGATQVTELTLTSVRAPKLNGDGSTLNYYDPSDGRFYGVDNQGNIRSLLPDAFPNADSIVWSQDTSKAIVEFPDGANISVNLATGDTATLPSHWQDFSFSPNNPDQIAAKSIGTDPGNRWLLLANSDGSQAQTVAALGNNYDKVQVSWSPNDQVVAFSDTGVVTSGFGRKQILPIGKNQENFPGLIVEGFSFDPLWSTTGEQILYSTNGPSSNYLPQLWLVDGTSQTLGDNRRSLTLNTWADKCTYSDATTAYCAVPKQLPAGAGLQRALAYGEPDTVYRINTATGTAVQIADPESGVSMTNLQVSADGSTLYYQNEQSGTLQQLRLK